MAMMNMSPPMVGVPCLAICQVGPSSLMDWPAFSRLRAGMRILPRTAVRTKLTARAIRISAIIDSSDFIF